MSGCDGVTWTRSTASPPSGAGPLERPAHPQRALMADWGFGGWRAIRIILGYGRISTIEEGSSVSAISFCSVGDGGRGVGARGAHVRSRWEDGASDGGRA